MAYQALYRKWRPMTFEDVRGQDAIVTTLKNQLKMGRIGHAYLFCGTRGTGKTSIAKIFARAVNCEHPVDGSPCNECEMCVAANEQRSMNVIEIDAASNNGVDSIRQIRDEVAFSPAQGRYKVYIIDEAHMLSPGAFNALLKTLEEPPSYVIFILATTDPNRIPATILSRCQRYDFHRITVPVIAGRLREIADTEGIDADEDALEYIARMGDGSMRDALSIFDQCVSFYPDRKLTREEALNVLGAVDDSVFGELFRCITDGDVGTALKIIDDAIMQGRDVSQFTADLTLYLRNLLMIRCGDEAIAAQYVASGRLEEMKAEARMADTETLLRYIRVVSELAPRLRYSTQKRIVLEMAAVQLCRPQMEDDFGSLVQRVGSLEKQVEKLTALLKSGVRTAPGGSGTGNRSAAPERKAPEQVRTDEESARPSGPDAAADADAASGSGPEAVQRVLSNWQAAIRNAQNPLQTVMGDVNPVAGEGRQLVLQCPNKFTFEYFGDDQHRSGLRELLKRVAHADVDIAVRKMNVMTEDGADADEFFGQCAENGIPVEDEE